MPLDSLLNLEYEKINAKAEKEKSVAKYLIDLISADYKNFQNAFSNNGVLLDEELYGKVQELIEELICNEIYIQKGNQYSRDLNSPEKKLGWIRHGNNFNAGSKTGGKATLYKILFTTKGKKVLDGYKQTK